MKSIVFRIKAGRLKAEKWWIPKFMFGKTIDFIYSVNEAAHYDYNNLVNAWNRITGVSDFYGNRVFLDFRSGASGVIVSVCFRLLNGTEKREVISNIIPGVSYKVTITKDTHFFIVSHTAFESRVDFTCLHHSKGLLPSCFVRFLPSRLGGLFTLNKDLKVKLVIK